MESRKTLHLLTLIFSILMIEKSMASQIPPDDDNSRIRMNGSVSNRDGSWNGNSSDQGTLLVPPPSTKTTIAVSTAVSPTSATSMTSVNSSSSSNTSSTTVTGGGIVSKYSSTRTSNNSTSSTTFSHTTHP